MLLTQSDVRALLRDLFEEEALALGGLVAVYEIEDDLVWKLVRTMDAVRTRVLRQLEAGGSVEERQAGSAAPKPHPAIEAFLLRVQRA